MNASAPDLDVLAHGIATGKGDSASRLGLTLIFMDSAEKSKLRLDCDAHAKVGANGEVVFTTEHIQTPDRHVLDEHARLLSSQHPTA